MKIHKEGYSILIKIFITLLVLNLILIILFNYDINHWIIWSSAIIFLLSVNFFRVPKREKYVDSNAIVAPADGKIVVIEEVVEDEYIKDKAIQVSIFMNVFNVHINWFPVNGKIKHLKHHNGRYLSAYLPKASRENERTTIGIEHPTGNKIALNQIAGAVARRIVCYACTKREAEQGEELGFIKFGSRVDIYLPLNAKIDVKPGQIVKGKQSVIGWFDNK
ncbi:phosphatidylserine decarboxylase family protein [Marinilabiliaceae bacterium ANBcel2]|nr:phosphatidylserine decarboxylase family protein [Marinilabiliaceae bacterium ANBcel2]